MVYFPDQAIDLEMAQQGYGAARGIERGARVFDARNLAEEKEEPAAREGSEKR